MFVQPEIKVPLSAAASPEACGRLRPLDRFSLLPVLLSECIKIFFLVGAVLALHCSTQASLVLQCAGSQAHGLSSCSAQVPWLWHSGSVVVVYRLSWSVACGILVP